MIHPMHKFSSEDSLESCCKCVSYGKKSEDIMCNCQKTDLNILRDYLQLNVSLENMYELWSESDENFRNVARTFTGIRMLRQDPIECLFSFICSSNNNISRITSMVEKLASNYGEKIMELDGQEYFSFPQVSSLAKDGVEERLRTLGFGYRAKYIQRSAEYIIAQGGEKWLYDLREMDYPDAKASLLKLCGVGAKVADCVLLMCLDKPGAIPVDTHVWQIAARDYMPKLKQAKSLTDTLYNEIETMTITKPTEVILTKRRCAKCEALAAVLDTPPWLLGGVVNKGPRSHESWCQRRARYEAYNYESKMSDKKFIDEMVKAHNEYRSRHQAKDLKHAKDLTEFAQKWADHLVATNSFEHSNCDLKGERLGENIAMKWSSRPDAYSGQDATDQWYSEVKQHTFGGEPRTLSSGHFTQVVWKGSKEMGVGKAQSKDGKTIVVASYRPAGNMGGKFAENVLPPKDGKIILPVQKDTSSSGGPFASRFGDGGASGGTERKTTKTITRTEGGVKKTIVEETIIKADGSKVTTTRETTSTDGGDAGRFKLKSNGSKSKSKRRDSSSSSSSSSDDEKKKSKDKKKDKADKPQKIKDFIDEAVKVHNELRSKHGASKLKHAKDLSEFAQKWAENLASKNAFQHSDCMLGGERIGENICCKWSSTGADYTGREACEQWYSEISKHDFSTEPRSLGSGHFTQMVWKGSREMGIGKAKTSNGKVIVVANYRPAGNIVGHFVENVAPLKK
ncbi:uncharacterized protein LOC128223804 isoform X2 [Mya arenaria]|uniref:uncharacterized protein LOC128223804 isoform X2 n=1 Tax=Mya arenaria TaxID=6604 RepID=UPI0022E43575|nr:uncharacterized protein LOC128223804 isoform X2 [Mya arenaria]